jgi:hypothetical protein
LLQEKIKAWAAGAGVQGDLAAICKDPKTNEFLLKELTATGKEGKLKVGLRRGLVDAQQARAKHTSMRSCRWLCRW